MAIPPGSAPHRGILKGQFCPLVGVYKHLILDQSLKTRIIHLGSKDDMERLFEETDSRDESND